MGFETGLVLTALLLFLKTYCVYCQIRVDCLSQPFASSQLLPSGPALLQATPQLVAPNLVKQIVRPLDYVQDLAPIVPSFGCIPGLVPGMLPMPPIIIDSSDDDDDWQNLLYLLILAMKNKNDGGYDNGCYNCCGGCCNCCGGSCNCCNGCGNCCGTCSNGCCNCGANTCITYVPYPVPVPMPSGPYYGSSDNCGDVASDDGCPSEINVIINADSTS